MGFLCQLSEHTCFFNVGEFWRSRITVLAKWEPPCLLWGRSRSGGLFWLLFAAAGKESLARQWAKPQEQLKNSRKCQTTKQKTET